MNGFERVLSSLNKSVKLCKISNTVITSISLSGFQVEVNLAKITDCIKRVSLHENCRCLNYKVTAGKKLFSLCYSSDQKWLFSNSSESFFRSSRKL